nr:MAG TPA: hypothetical protein [Caudoviricetes sp.]
MTSWRFCYTTRFSPSPVHLAIFTPELIPILVKYSASHCLTRLFLN